MTFLALAVRVLERIIESLREWRADGIWSATPASVWLQHKDV